MIKIRNKMSHRNVVIEKDKLNTFILNYRSSGTNVEEMQGWACVLFKRMQRSCVLLHSL